MRFLLFATLALPAFSQSIAAPTADFFEVLRAPDGSFYTITSTRQPNLPTTPGALQSSFGGGQCLALLPPPQPLLPCPDLYLQHLAPDGQTVLAATYFGGNREESQPTVLLAPDGTLLLSFLSASPSVAGGLNPEASNRGVLLRLSPHLDRALALRRLPQNSTFRVLAQSSTELYLAGTELSAANRHQIFLEALDPHTLALRRSFTYEGSPATSLFALQWRPSGDLILAWRSSRASTHIAAIDPTSGHLLWNTPLAESDEIRAVALLPGDGMAVFANSFDASGAPIAFLQRLSAGGQLLEAPLPIGSHVQFARTDASGLLEWIGLSIQRGFLRTSTLAAQRCRPTSAAPAQPLYYARMPFSQGEPDYVSYFPLAAASTLPSGVLDAFPLLRQSTSLSPLPLPLPLSEPTPACLEADADNFAVSTRRSLPAPADRNGTRSLAPGEFLTLYGAGLSEGEAIFRPEESGALPTEVAGTRLLLDGRPAGIIEISPTRLTIAVPLDLATRERVSVVLERHGVPSAPVEFTVVPNRLYLFSTALPGQGFAGVYRNGELVTPANPARPGEEVAVYLNGLGLLDANPDADKILTSASVPRPLASPSARIDGASLQEIPFVGGILGQLPGLLQLNVRLAPDLNLSGRQTLRLTLGNQTASTDFWLP